jgi:uncharacterized protein
MSAPEPVLDPELRQLRARILPVLRKYKVQKAIVFGSLARGEGTRRSDLDLILIQHTEKRFLDRYEGILYDLGGAVSGRDIDVLIYTPEELDSISQRPFIASALRDGKVIYESR